MTSAGETIEVLPESGSLIEKGPFKCKQSGKFISLHFQPYMKEEQLVLFCDLDIGVKAKIASKI